MSSARRAALWIESRKPLATTPLRVATFFRLHHSCPFGNPNISVREVLHTCIFHLLLPFFLFFFLLRIKVARVLPRTQPSSSPGRPRLHRCRSGSNHIAPVRCQLANRSSLHHRQVARICLQTVIIQVTFHPEHHVDRCRFIRDCRYCR